MFTYFLPLKIYLEKENGFLLTLGLPTKKKEESVERDHIGPALGF
jgi:hypothetical protein